MKDVFDECEEILNQLKPPPSARPPSVEECDHKDVTVDVDGWYVCTTCHIEMRVNPNEHPYGIKQILSDLKAQRRLKSRTKTITSFLREYHLPFEEELLDAFLVFSHKYEELFPERKNLISKDYILFQLLRKRDYQVPVKLPKLEKTLVQNENICRTIFEALNWSFT